jgi:hypothetical protein
MTRRLSPPRIIAPTPRDGARSSGGRAEWGLQPDHSRWQRGSQAQRREFYGGFHLQTPRGRRLNAGGRPDARLPPPPNACHCPGLVQSALARGRHTLGLYPLPPPSRFALLPAQLWPASDQRPMHKVSLLMKVCSCYDPGRSALATQAWGDLRGADFIGLALPSCGDE